MARSVRHNFGSPVFALGAPDSMHLSRREHDVLIGCGGGGKVAKKEASNFLDVYELSSLRYGKLNRLHTHDMGELLVTAIAVSPDAKMFSCCICERPETRVFSYDPVRHEVKDLDTITPPGAPKDLEQTALVFNPAGDRLAVGGSDGVVRIWRLARAMNRLQAKIFRTMPGHLGKVISVSFNKSGTAIVTASADGTARVSRLDGSEPHFYLPTVGADVTTANKEPGGCCSRPRRKGGYVAKPMDKVWEYRCATFARDGESIFTLETCMPFGPAVVVRWVKASATPEDTAASEAAAKGAADRVAARKAKLARMKGLRTPAKASDGSASGDGAAASAAAGAGGEQESKGVEASDGASKGSSPSPSPPGPAPTKHSVAWKRAAAVRVCDEVAGNMSVSDDGAAIAVGTQSGFVYVVETDGLTVAHKARRHDGIVTTTLFSGIPPAVPSGKGKAPPTSGSGRRNKAASAHEVSARGMGTPVLITGGAMDRAIFASPVPSLKGSRTWLVMVAILLVSLFLAAKMGMWERIAAPLLDESEHDATLGL